MDFTDAQLRRYARHIILREIGGVGQARLLEAAVLVVGAGGLGSPLLLYLAAAGIGRIGIVDDDTVDGSNLHRQVIHDAAAVGAAKVDSAAAGVQRLSPDTTVVRHRTRLTDGNAAELIRPYDLVADGSDNLPTRIAVHDACLRLGKTLVSGSVQGVDGQLTTYKAHLGPPHPCLRCLLPEMPAGDALPSCAQAGVLGPAAGVLGTLQAVEVVKELLGSGRSLSGELLLYDAMAARFDRLRIQRRPGCGAECSLLPPPVEAAARASRSKDQDLSAS